jgi:hypothetical protein
VGALADIALLRTAHHATREPARRAAVHARHWRRAAAIAESVSTGFTMKPPTCVSTCSLTCCLRDPAAARLPATTKAEAEPHGVRRVDCPERLAKG